MPRTLSRETISTKQRKIAALARHTPTRVLTTRCFRHELLLSRPDLLLSVSET